MVTTFNAGLTPVALIDFSKTPKITAVPPPGPHGTISFAVLQGKLGAACAVVVVAIIADLCGEDYAGSTEDDGLAVGGVEREHVQARVAGGNPR